MALLKISDLAVSFGSTVAVDGVNLSIHPGQTLAVVGESGCGKSVTALSILRLIQQPPGRISRGQIVFDGRDLLQLSPQDMLRVRGAQIAMIFQEPMSSLNPVFTIGEQIMEAVNLHQRVDRKQTRAIAVQAMHEVGIPDPASRLDDFPHQFSGGMRQRVMIAMALACRPRLLLADEPTTALDVTVQDQILSLLRQVQRERGMAVMLITHDLGIVAQNADVVCVMYAGRVVEYASVVDLFQRPLHPYTRALLECRPSLRQRRDRLRTISELLGQGSTLPPIQTRTGAIQPWWPGLVQAAATTERVEANTPLLVEAQPEHWVATTAEGRAERLATTAPDISRTRPDAVAKSA